MIIWLHCKTKFHPNLSRSGIYLVKFDFIANMIIIYHRWCLFFLERIYIIMKNKHLSFDDRLEIEKGQKKIIRMEITI